MRQYLWYNAVLRQWPKDLYEELEAGDHLFPTTIHVLASGVQKLARTMKLQEGVRLYRGLGGTTDMPVLFFRADACGRRGYAELGFMSTTEDKAVATQYSGVKEGRPLPMVLELVVRQYTLLHTDQRPISLMQSSSMRDRYANLLPDERLSSTMY